jgi:hypothetical protein
VRRLGVFEELLDGEGILKPFSDRRNVAFPNYRVQSSLFPSEAFLVLILISHVFLSFLVCLSLVLGILPSLYNWRIFDKKNASGQKAPVVINLCNTHVNELLYYPLY